MTKPDTTDVATPLEKTDVVLSSVFGTPPIEVPHNDIIETSGAVVPASQPDSGEIDADHQFARSNMYNLLQQGQSAFAYALEVAKSSENPRAFEVAGNIMKNLADINSQLLDLHEKKANVKKQSEPVKEPTKVVNNSVVFHGSTADLAKMLQNIRKD